MLATTFLHKILQKSLPNIHNKRLKVLLEATSTLFEDTRLTLSDIARHIKGKAKVKNKIKKIDRLLSNKKLYEESPYIYQQLNALLLKSADKAVIAIDWSGCCSNERFIIQASLLLGQGRSIPVYKEIHTVNEYLKPKIEAAFLDNLKDILPKGIKIIIVTDAGFRSAWFKKIINIGWDFVGRLRGKVYYREEITNQWYCVRNLHSKATNKAKYVGKVELGKRVRDKRIVCNMVNYKSPKKYRPSKELKRTKKYAISNKEPWILVTSLNMSNKQLLASITKNIYKKRMEIEQNFRDDKSERFGFSLRHSNTKNIARLTILLLIVVIATIVLWLIGFAGELSNLQRDFQANTIKNRRVLSLLTLGKQIILHCLMKIKVKYIINSLNMISSCCYEMALEK